MRTHIDVLYVCTDLNQTLLNEEHLMPCFPFSHKHLGGKTQHGLYKQGEHASEPTTGVLQHWSLQGKVTYRGNMEGCGNDITSIGRYIVTLANTATQLLPILQWLLPTVLHMVRHRVCATQGAN